MLTWVFIFLGAVDLTAVLILIGLAIATLEEICRREVTNKMRWIDPNPGKDERSIKNKRKNNFRIEIRTWWSKASNPK